MIEVQFIDLVIEPLKSLDAFCWRETKLLKVYLDHKVRYPPFRIYHVEYNRGSPENSFSNLDKVQASFGHKLLLICTLPLSLNALVYHLKLKLHREGEGITYLND